MNMANNIATSTFGNQSPPNADHTTDFTVDLPACCEDLTAEQCKVITKILQDARLFLEDGGYINGYSEIGFRTESHPIYYTENDELGDIEALVRILELAGETRPDFAVMVVCVWTVPGKTPQQVTSLQKKYGTFGAMPDAVCNVAFTVETICGAWSATAAMQKSMLSKTHRIFCPTQPWTKEPISRPRFLALVSAIAHHNYPG